MSANEMTGLPELVDLSLSIRASCFVITVQGEEPPRCTREGERP